TITGYYRNYYEIMMEIGGCPILKVNSDTKDNNEALYNFARQVAKRMLDDLEEIISKGKERNEISQNIDAGEYARNIYSMIEGSAFMSATHEDPVFVSDMMNHIDSLIRDKIRISTNLDVRTVGRSRTI
ncbi:MAG: TetR/AcrR family transcriptional repressor of nem operon, partial [Arenicella sp.]